MSEKDQFVRQVDRILNSHGLHGSESLCKLLRYLANHALNSPGLPLKEYQIATEVYGRPADFDPQSDSTIRVQAGRLRTKMAEYYASEGVDDLILVELPKGTYVPSFHHRTANPRGLANNATHHEEIGAPQPNGKWLPAFVAASIVLAVALLGVAGVFIARKPSSSALASVSAPAPAVFQTFWNPFVTGPEEPLVIFSNAAFVGRPETGMRYYNATRDSQGVIWDHYTGVGEVLAVHDLDEVFSSLRRKIHVKRGSLFSLDDAQSNDLIFVGSPSENLTLLDIPGSKDFIFQRVATGPRQGDLAIVNVHPQHGEAATNLASPSGAPLTEDFAVVALMPGLNPARSVMILAGTTTFGTQGAVEFVSRQGSVADLLSKLSVSKPSELKPFEALLHIKIARGVPVETELVAVRKNAP